MEKLDRATHEIRVDGDLGEVQIADEVVAIIADTDVKVDLALNLVFEANILEVSGRVQEKVKSAIESMTGMKVSVVNVRVAGVVLE